MKTRAFVIAAVLVLLVGSVSAQTPSPTSQLLLDNDSVRVVRITLAPGQTFTDDLKNDVVAVRLSTEAAEFIPTGTQLTRNNSINREVVDLLIELKKHWDSPIRPCAEPLKCTRETKTGNEPFAWTTTLFTNGFVTAMKHRALRGGSLTSSYFSAKGTDVIVIVPFSELKANFGGIEETLKTGQPYFSKASEVEVTGNDAEARWFVLRLHSPKT